MPRLLVSRVLQFVPVLVGVSFLTFAMMNLLPGDTAEAILGENVNPQALSRLRHQLNLNTPFIERYFHWFGQVLTGHLGTSLITGQPVSTVISQRLPVTLELVILSVVIALLVAIPAAALSAFRLNGVFDRGLRALAMFFLSVPGFMLGVLLILFFTVDLHWFPSTGYKPLSAGPWQNLRTMLLPALALSAVLFANYSRILRADMAEQLANEDYVQTARAKGVSNRRMVLRHVLRNSLFGLITVVGVNMGTLIGGTVIIESVFALPGVGQDLVNSISNRDVTVVQGIVLLFAIAVVVSNLLADLLYTVADPRVRYGRIGS